MAQYRLSKYGIAYDLSNTPYVLEALGYLFCFSSPGNMKKFLEGWQKRVDWLNDSLSRRFHLNMQMDEVAVLQWYGMCEGRGFRVMTPDGEWLDCPENTTFRGTRLRGNG